jgi:hypothetical protein
LRNIAPWWIVVTGPEEDVRLAGCGSRSPPAHTVAALAAKPDFIVVNPAQTDRARHMGCERCDAFDVELAIPTPAMLRSVAEKARDAVRNGTLSYNSFESSRELIGQQSFMDLELSTSLPDVLRYHFDCKHCGNCYALFVETYHGAGGKWFRTGSVPSTRAPNGPTRR